MNYISLKSCRYFFVAALLFCICLNVRIAAASVKYESWGCYPIPQSCEGGEYNLYICDGVVAPGEPFYCPSDFSYFVADTVTLSARGPGNQFKQTVPLTAVATGAPNYNFYLYYRNLDTGVSREEQIGWAYSPFYFYFTPPAGRYDVSISASGNTIYDADVISWSQNYNVTHDVNPTGASITPLYKQSTVGTPATFTAYGQGTSPTYLEYDFLLCGRTGAVCNWSSCRDLGWRSLSTLTLTNTAVGEYCVEALLRTQYGATAQAAVAHLAVTNGPPPASVDLYANPVTEQVTGRSATFNAIASGSGSEFFEYRFWMGIFNGASCNAAGLGERDWSSASSWTTNMPAPGGDYCVGVEVRTQKDLVDLVYDVIDFGVTYDENPTGATISASPPDKQKVGNPVTFSAYGAGSSHYEYDFLLASRSGALCDWGKASIRPYDPSNTWTLSNLPVGDYCIKAAVRTEFGYTAVDSVEIPYTIFDAPHITTLSLPNTVYGLPYNSGLSATGGLPPYDWKILSGSLPAGLSLTPSTGVISGVSSSIGNYEFEVRVRDGSENLAAIDYKAYNISVYAPLSISTSSSLPTAMVGSTYNQQLSASGGSGTYTWTLVSGSLPGGLTLNSAGVISGKAQSSGSYTFIASVIETLGSPAVSKQFTIVAVYPPISITTITLPSVTIGSTYYQTLSATGGNGTFSWSLTSGTLPAGLIFNTAGIISGTPTSTGDYTFTLRVDDSQSPAATAAKQYTIRVTPPPLTINTTILANGQFGTSYNQILSVTGGDGTYSWQISSGSLPSGLFLDSNSGTISGTPSDVGRFDVTLQASDSQSIPATASRAYSFNITNSINQSCTQEGTESSTKVCTGSTTDVISGVVNHDQELFSTKGGTFGTSIELFYRSMPAYNGSLGLGWSHSYDMFLTVNSDGSIVSKDGAGSKSFYTKSGNSYVSPPGDFSTLVKNNDNSYTITYRDGLKKNFRADGKISSIVDRFTNTLLFGYTGSDLTSVTDQAWRTTYIGYDQSTTPHRISTITDPHGKVYDFAYQGNNLYRVTNPAADPAVSPERGYWEYVYDPAGSNYLKSKRDPKGNVTQYTYYADHRMWTASDPNGQTRTIVYPTTTGILRTSTLAEKDQGQWLYTFDSQKGIIKEKADPNGKKTKFSYYPNGTIKSTTVPKNGAVSLTTFYTYDSYGNLLTSTEPVDLSTYALDPENVADPVTLASLSPPIKPAFRYAYSTSSFDRITSVSDERVNPARITTFVYTTENGGEVVTATATPGNYVTVTKKNPNSSVRVTIDANQKPTTFTYYPDTTANRTAGINGLLWAVTDPAGIATIVTSYDKNGNPLNIQVKDLSGVVKLTSDQQHDALNRLTQLTKTTTALPAIVTNYGYDNVGNLISRIDGERRETKYEFTYNNQVKKITDAKLNDTIFTFSGSEGNGVDMLVGVFDANVTKNTPLGSQPHTAFSYDKLNRLEYETDQLGKKLHYTYYDNGQFHEKYDATNATPGTLLVTYTYNNRGQVTDKTFTDGTYEHFTYYPDGKLWTAGNQNISYTYVYTTDGRLQTVTDTTNSRTISYDLYDGLGQRKQVTILKGAGAGQRILSYDYDGANRPWHITTSAGTFTYAYDKLGRRDTLTYPNNTLVDWDFDDLNRLTAITNKVVSGAPFAAFNYTDYDKVSNRITVAGSKNETYGYDELYRLRSVTSAKPEALSYDAVGNRQIGPSPDDTAYVHNSANQMTAGRKLGYDYDDFGNQTTKTVPGASDKSWVQTWDYNNRLVKVEKTKGAEKRTVTFKYDPLGRRINKQLTTIIDGTSKTKAWSYVYDGDNIVVEIYTDENNTTTTSYYTQGPGTDEHLAVERGGQYYYFHADGLGSIAAITDTSHAVVQSYEYDSYGMVTPANNTFRNSYAYTGREWDPEAGLYYYRARYYDPMEGRFISKDPIGFGGGDVNLYEYVQNNTINYIDPSGLKWLYQQSTGKMYYQPEVGGAPILVGEGYAGRNKGLNNPDYESVSNIGPLPQGLYKIGIQRDNTTGTGHVLKSSMRLIPDEDNEMYGRAGFLIHRGNMKTMKSSKGCIIMTDSVRNTIGINRKLDNVLEVIE